MVRALTASCSASRYLISNAQGYNLVAQVYDDTLCGHLTNTLDALHQTLITR